MTMLLPSDPAAPTCVYPFASYAVGCDAFAYVIGTYATYTLSTQLARTRTGYGSGSRSLSPREPATDPVGSWLYNYLIFAPHPVIANDRGGVGRT